MRDGSTQPPVRPGQEARAADPGAGPRPGRIPVISLRGGHSPPPAAGAFGRALCSVWLVHWTLDPKKSLAVAILWVVLAALLAWLATPFPLLQIAVGVVAGVLAGALQRRSFEEAPGLFREAVTAAQVRRAAASTRGGRRAIGLQWVASFALLGVSVLALRGGASPRSPAYGLLSGYFVFMALRDLLAIPGLQKLAGGRG